MDRRCESEMFNKAAEYYDLYRPTYPSSMIQEIVDFADLKPNSEILEIGSGSGKATELFCHRKFCMTCIDPGKDLVRIGNSRFPEEKFTFVEGRFEDMELSEAYYDTIFSAQAFHWVPQPMGYEKSAKVLKPNGTLALMWNMYITYENEMDQDLLKLSEKYGGLADFVSESSCEKRIESIVAGIEGSGYFETPTVIRKLWSVDYTAEEYYGFALTGNRFIQKSNQEKEQAYKDICELAQRHGGRIHRPYLCVLYLAKRK